MGKPKPFCKRMHEMVPNNLYVDKCGKRTCKACALIRASDAYAREQAKKREAQTVVRVEETKSEDWRVLLCRSEYQRVMAKRRAA
jgi:hypothetical protein